MICALRIVEGKPKEKFLGGFDFGQLQDLAEEMTRVFHGESCPPVGGDDHAASGHGIAKASKVRREGAEQLLGSGQGLTIDPTGKITAGSATPGQPTPPATAPTGSPTVEVLPEALFTRITPSTSLRSPALGFATGKPPGMGVPLFPPLGWDLGREKIPTGRSDSWFS